MASRIQGITVEIGGDTTKLSKALESVNKSIKGTQSGLKDGIRGVAFRISILEYQKSKPKCRSFRTDMIKWQHEADTIMDAYRQSGKSLDEVMTFLKP